MSDGGAEYIAHQLSLANELDISERVGCAYYFPMEMLQFLGEPKKKNYFYLSRAIFRPESLNGRQKPSVYFHCAHTHTHTTYSAPFLEPPFAPRPYRRTNGCAYINIDRKCESQKQYPIFGNSDAGAADAAAAEE